MQVEIELQREKDCKHSVRFKADQSDPNNPPAIDTVYISRTHPGINKARSVKVTLEVTE